MSKLRWQHVSQKSVSFVLKSSIIEVKLFRTAKIVSYSKILFFVCLRYPWRKV